MNEKYIILIQNWGYLLMFGSAIIEGETFLILGGIAAATAILNLKIVILLSISGAIIHDSIFFYLGKIFGWKIKNKNYKWKSKLKTVNKLIKKYDFWIILAFRFIYGLRSIIPFTLGTSKISDIKFLVCDCIGALVWVIVFVLGGYYFGNTIECIMSKITISYIIKKYWWIILATILTISLITFITFIMFYIKKHHYKKSKLK